MGKGQRAREARAGIKEEQKKQVLKKQRRKLISKIIGIIIAVVIVLGIAGGAIYNSIASTGYFLRNTVVMSTDNFKVDNAMMLYYLKNQYYSFVDQYNDYLSMYGLDTQKSLKSQKYGDGTWFDFFFGQAKTQAEQTLALAEKAKAEGYELTEDDHKEIDETLSSLSTLAEQNKTTEERYISSLFGEGMKKSDIRRAVELTTFASKYYEDYLATLEYSDDDLQAYFDANKSDFIKADYVSYAINANVDENMSDADKTAAINSAKEQASKLTACKNEDEFKAMLEKYLVDEKVAQQQEGTDDEKLESAKKEAETEISGLSKTNFLPADKDDEGNDIEKSEFEKWLFASDRMANDTYLQEPDTSDAQDSTDISFTAYLVTRPAYFDDYATVNLGRILFEESDYETLDAAKVKADEVLAEFDAEKTTEKFAKLAKQYNSNSSDDDGIYEGLTNDTSAFPKEVVDWAFAPERKDNDTTVVKTSEGYYLIYYTGKGEIAWKLKARTSKKNADIENHLKELTDTYKVTIKESKMKSIKA